MLNFIAILIVDWLIKSVEPVILGDVKASVPKTPVILPAAMLPTMDTITSPLALLLLMAGCRGRRFPAELSAIAERQSPSGAAQRHHLGGGHERAAAFSWFLIAVGDHSKLHFGFWLMIAAVWLTDWFPDAHDARLRAAHRGRQPERGQIRRHERAAQYRAGDGAERHAGWD